METTDLPLLFLRGFDSQLLIKVLPDLPQFALGVRSERAGKLLTHDIDELEKRSDEFPGVVDPRTSGNRELSDYVSLAFFRRRWAFSRLIGDRKGYEVWKNLGIVEGFDQREVSKILEDCFENVRKLCFESLVRMTVLGRAT